MNRIMCVLFLLILFSCKDRETFEQSFYLNLENTDSIVKFIYLDSWLISSLDKKISDNNRFFYSSDFFINKIEFHNKDKISSFNRMKLGSNSIKGSLGLEKIRFAKLPPQKRISLEIRNSNLNSKTDMQSKKISYQLIYFNSDILDSLTNYTIYNTDSLIINLEGSKVHPTRIFSKPLVDKEIQRLFNSKHYILEQTL